MKIIVGLFNLATIVAFLISLAEGATIYSSADNVMQQITGAIWLLLAAVLWSAWIVVTNNNIKNDNG